MVTRGVHRHVGLLAGIAAAATLVAFGSSAALGSAGQRRATGVELLDSTWSVAVGHSWTDAVANGADTMKELCGASGNGVARVDFGTAPVSGPTYVVRALRVFFPNTVDTSTPPSYRGTRSFSRSVEFVDLGGGTYLPTGGAGRGGTLCSIEFVGFVPSGSGARAATMTIEIVTGAPCQGPSNCPAPRVEETISLPLTGAGAGVATPPPSTTPPPASAGGAAAGSDGGSSSDGSAASTDRCIAPQLVGKTLAQARAAVAAAHCTLGKVTHRTSKAAARGHVTAQTPPSRVSRAAGAAISVVIGR